MLDIVKLLNNSKLIRYLSIISLIGLIVAVSGITWVVVKYSLLAQAATQFNGNWSKSTTTNFPCNNLQISNQGILINIEGSSCTGSGYDDSSSTPFTSQPFETNLYDFNSSTNFHMTLSLNNDQGTELKVLASQNGASIETLIFKKVGS